MDLQEMKAKALSLMAEYSVDGQEIGTSENADYLNRMNRSASDAQFEIAEKVPIDAVFTYIQVGTSETGYNRVALPEDFNELRFVNFNDERFTDFRIENGNFIVRKTFNGSFDLSYHKNPTELTLDTPDTYEFEVDKHTHPFIPYYVGGMSLTDENPSLSASLMNMFYSKLGTTSKKNMEYPIVITQNYGM
jgi:hypothetical protein